MNQLRLEQSPEVETPAVHRSEEKQIADSKTTLLEADMKKKFKSCVMPTAYMSQDDPSAEAVKSLARGMSSPSDCRSAAVGACWKVLGGVPDCGNRVRGSEHVGAGHSVRGHESCRLCAHAAQYDIAGDDAWEAVCETREQCPNDDRVVWRRVCKALGCIWRCCRTAARQEA